MNANLKQGQLVMTFETYALSHVMLAGLFLVYGEERWIRTKSAVVAYFHVPLAFATHHFGHGWVRTGHPLSALLFLQNSV